YKHDKDGEGFALTLDTKDFSPEELSVKQVGRKLKVSGKTEKKLDDGEGSYSYRCQEFRQEFDLPEKVNPETVTCSLAHDGKLHIQAPKNTLSGEEEVGRKLKVSGKTEKKLDDGEGSYSYRCQEFRQEFDLPEKVNPETVTCSLAHDGKLHIQAPKNTLSGEEELSVKQVGRKLRVSGKTEKKLDDGEGSYSYRCQEFRQEFDLPEKVNPETVTCSLAHDGKLHIQAPKNTLSGEEEVAERVVPINCSLDVKTPQFLSKTEGSITDTQKKQENTISKED
uniref:SHSP domain-containing protein n=1 Tax=Oncorhynchus tshawytscha TaxID=74940 RepID=A0A8C8JX46_ONCTS